MLSKFYALLIMMSKIIGPWFLRFISWFICTGIFIFSPSRVKISLNFYGSLFPEKNWFYYLKYTWNQYHNFTYIYIDRFFLQDSGDISYTSEGWNHLIETVKSKKGGIILMSHMGNWEIAANLLNKEGLKLMLYMGKKHKEQLEKIQKEMLIDTGIKIIAVDEEGGSPFDIIDGINFLKDGGLVSLTGDRIWRSDQRTVTVNLLDHEVSLPEMPHVFALLSGAPLFIFFVFRTGNKKYHFKISEPIFVNSVNRTDRIKSIINSAQNYANYLEETLRQHPSEWYHFEQFLGKKIKKYGQK